MWGMLWSHHGLDQVFEVKLVVFEESALLAITYAIGQASIDLTTQKVERVKYARDVCLEIDLILPPVRFRSMIIGMMLDMRVCT